MRTKFLLMASLFLTIILFTPGCLGTPVSVILLERQTVADAATSDTPRPTVDTPTTLADAPGDQTALDGGVRTDAVHERMETPTGDTLPQAILLAPTTCHGRRLPTNTPGLALVGEHTRVWHLCYKTPTRTTSTHILAAQRPERFRFDVITPEGPRTLLVAPAPASANPWTISFLVILPANMVPAFQGVNLYGDARTLGMVASSSPGAFPSVQGEIQSWRLMRDASQNPEQPDTVCHDPQVQTAEGAFFLPMDQCPGHGETCPLLGQLDCRSLAPSS